MKKCLVLGLLTFVFLWTSGCKKSEEDSDTDTDNDDYVSIRNLSVSANGTVLTDSPPVTWQLGFPLFYTLEAGLGTSSSATADVVNWTDIGVVTTHTFTGLSLSECTDYYPMVRAKNTSDEVLDTHVVTTPFNMDLTDPTAPSGLIIGTDALDDESPTTSWTASTDNCGLAGYLLTIGTTSGGNETLDWSTVATTSHQATSGVALSFGTNYYTSVKAVDITDRESTVTTSTPWRLRSPSAHLIGTQTLGGTDFYLANSYMRWSGATLNSDYFSFSVIAEPETLVVTQAGDYMLHLTLPLQVSAACGARCVLRAMVLINDVPLPEAISVAYVMNTLSSSETSNHLTTYLQNLSANDEIKIYLEKGTAGGGSLVTEGVQLYVEYLYPNREFFYATAAQTLGSANLNQASDYLSWTQEKTSAPFTFNPASPADISLAVGNYLVYLNFPFIATGVCSARNNVKLRVSLNGAQILGAQANQGGIDCQGGHLTGSVHWVGVLQGVTAGQVLRVSALLEASNATIEVETGKLGTIIVEKLSSIENYIAVSGTRTVGSTNFNAAAASPIQWGAQIATDATTFTHSTVTNNHQITITQAGSYLVLYTDHLTSVTARVNPRIRLQKNGANVSGGVCSSNVITNTTGNNEGSCSMNFYLTGVNANDVITVTSVQEANAGTATASSPALLTLLRVK